MKLRAAGRGHYDSGPNLTPLVDIVMVILIFLMLAGKFGTSEHFLSSNIPIAARGVGAVAPPPGYVPDEPLEIRVESPEPDRFVARVGNIEARSGTELRQRLTEMHTRLGETGTPPDKVQVVISPSKTVKYRFLIEVYEAAVGSGFSKVGFAQSR
jgi:biopolymer transport protein ExbD